MERHAALNFTERASMASHRNHAANMRAMATHEVLIFVTEMESDPAWVPQLSSGESARVGGLSWANWCRPGGMSCH
jgi:hypothetical protein